MGTTRHLLAAAVMPLALSAHAATTLGDHISVSGFGTIGAVATNTDAAQFRVDSLQPKGAGRSPNLGVDSKLGLQADIRLDDTFSAVAQLLTIRRERDRPVVEWLYGKAALPAGFDLKIGRMVMPAFMVSESRLVGYASHWLRAPTEVYLQYPATSFDGVQVQNRQRVGAVNLLAQLSLGESKPTLQLGPVSTEFEMKRLRSLVVQAETGNLLLHLGYTQAGEQTFSALRVPSTKDTFASAGIQYDDGEYVVRAEYVDRATTPALFDSNGWYLTGGRRLGAWTPYLMYSRMNLEGAFYRSKEPASTKAAGLRWDVRSGVALKAQLQSTQGGGSAVGFIGTTPAFVADKPSVKVYSLAVDFVF